MIADIDNGENVAVIVYSRLTSTLFPVLKTIVYSHCFYCVFVQYSLISYRAQCVFTLIFDAVYIILYFKDS